MKKLLALISVLILVFLPVVSGCAVSADSGNPYSRKSIEAQSNIFTGYGVDDSMIVACMYVYNSDMFKEKYGGDFEITNVVGSEGEIGAEPDISHCYLEIGKDLWCVDLSKEFLGKWKVTGCHLCENDEEKHGNNNVSAAE